MRSDIDSRPPPFPWHTSYLIVVALSAGLLGALYHLFPWFRESAGLVPAGVVVGMFTVTSLLHWYDVTANRVPRRR